MIWIERLTVGLEPEAKNCSGGAIFNDGRRLLNFAAITEVRRYIILIKDSSSVAGLYSICATQQFGNPTP